MKSLGPHKREGYDEDLPWHKMLIQSSLRLLNYLK